LRPLFVSPGLSRDAGERLGTILRCDGSPASRADPSSPRPASELAGADS